LSGGTGEFLVVLVSGREQFGTVTLLTVSAIIGAALIGQLLEGMSNRLSRPFGYFGGLLGIVIAGVVLSLFRDGILLVLTAFCLAGPWTQAIGRLRCIVQGCCHGMPVTPKTGRVIINEHSRVCGMAQLGGTPFYPTQLYSIIGYVPVGNS
jgi:prolipoprotein diacylglyceryltransferase